MGAVSSAPKIDSEDSLLTLAEVAKLLKCHPATVTRLLKRQRLHGFKIGSDWRFSRLAMQRWIAQQNEAALKANANAR